MTKENNLSTAMADRKISSSNKVLENKEVMIKIFQDHMINILLAVVFSLTLLYGGLYANYKFFTHVYFEKNDMLYAFSIISTVFVPQLIWWGVFCSNICNQIERRMSASN